MSFEKKYPNLCQFIGAWFPDADFEDLSDGQIVSRFCKAAGPEKVAEVIREGRRLLKQDRHFLNELGDLANIWMEDDAEAEAWLMDILHHLQDFSD
ncbi:hypothetical protein DENIS_2156 [Desulfonema ishimotonii]|uniref:CdiI immunity protein domain-containing protein n=1 Tax=Desulfonema ishimotonii TaxID=45657 RepID=A0A401FW53_9BACT|nr:contact-dependent growth inhibition system immunity protein [Desulfonema ishimotonii]GBC61196.1 hypothetical protein DENIS_2156 [Desulfonema ishimotonii]